MGLFKKADTVTPSAFADTWPEEQEISTWFLDTLPRRGQTQDLVELHSPAGRAIYRILNWVPPEFLPRSDKYLCRLEYAD